MGLFDRLPPRPDARRIALWVTTVLLARAILIAVHEVLGDVQQGEHGTLARRLVDEGTAAIVALPLLAVVAWGATRWPLGGGAGGATCCRSWFSSSSTPWRTPWGWRRCAGSCTR